RYGRNPRCDSTPCSFCHPTSTAYLRPSRRSTDCRPRITDLQAQEHCLRRLFHRYTLHWQPKLRRRHTQPRLCKRYAASARRRSCRTSLFPAGNLLHQRLEAWITAKIVEEWISREEEQVAFVASSKAVLERFNGAFFFA